MHTSIPFSRNIPLRHNVDIFIAGGGPAGVCAAVTAARAGKKVFIVEGSAAFGGNGTSGGLPMFCQMGDGINYLADGLGREISQKLRAAGGVAYPHTDLNEQAAGWIIYRGEILKRVYDGLVEESGANFSFLTQLIAVESKNGRVDHVICWGKSGIFAVQAKVYIDTTGDGDLCAWAGATYDKGDPAGLMQPPTLCSMWAQIDWDRANAAGHGIWQAEAFVEQAIRDGIFTVPDRHLPGMIPVGPHTAGGNIGHAFGVDGTDERSVTKGLVWGRKVLVEYERFYKQYLKGFENMELVGTAALLGIRETRRIHGDYELNLEDFKSRAIFPDEIGRYAYWVDLHQTQAGEPGMAEHLQQRQLLKLAPGESYGIPYRCLTPKALQNVLTAGRCLSADRSIQGSLRVMPGCMITGQAAGMAAALAADLPTPNVHEIPVKELQHRLAHIGAFLPNRPS